MDSGTNSRHGILEEGKVETEEEEGGAGKEAKEDELNHSMVNNPNIESNISSRKEEVE